VIPQLQFTDGYASKDAKSDLRILLVQKNMLCATGLFNNQNIHTISVVTMQLLSMKTKKIHIKKATLESLHSEAE